MLDAMPDLKMICYLGIGPQTQIDMKYAWSKGITLCNTPHYGDEAVAEHAIALMFALARKVVNADKSMRESKWERFGGSGIKGATMGILGLGGLGSELAAIGNGLGMKVICTTRNPSDERARAHNVEFVSLDELMSRSDYVQLAPVLNDDTTGIIGERELGLMKEGRPPRQRVSGPGGAAGRFDQGSRVGAAGGLRHRRLRRGTRHRRTPPPLSTTWSSPPTSPTTPQLP